MCFIFLIQGKMNHVFLFIWFLLTSLCLDCATQHIAFRELPHTYHFILRWAFSCPDINSPRSLKITLHIVTAHSKNLFIYFHYHLEFVNREKILAFPCSCNRVNLIFRHFSNIGSRTGSIYDFLEWHVSCVRSPAWVKITDSEYNNNPISPSP